MQSKISISMNIDLLEKVDIFRGDVARSRFISKLLETVIPLAGSNNTTCKNNGEIVS
jgi:hypothetical protein